MVWRRVTGDAGLYHGGRANIDNSGARPIGPAKPGTPDSGGTKGVRHEEPGDIVAVQRKKIVCCI